MKILFMTPRYPYPLLTGDRVRAFHQLEGLAKAHEVFLLCPHPPSPDDEEALRELIAHRVHISPSRVKSLGRMATGAFRRTPLQTLAHADQAYRREALSLIQRHQIDVAHVQLVRLGSILEGVRLPKFLDFVDALSVNMRQLAERSNGPKRLAAKVESKRLGAYEQLMVRTYDAGGITSPRDRCAIGNPENVFVIPNGAPTREGAPEEMERPDARIIFTGRMSYFPNSDAACWFADEIFPLVRVQIPHAEFVVVGADPPPKIVALAKLPGVQVLGFVPSVADELLVSTIAVVPMRCGTGMQNKVVEAIANGTPVVITSEGLGDLNFKDGEEVSLADTAESFAAAVVRLIKSRPMAQKQARAARIAAEKNYSWAASTEQLLRGYAYAEEAFKRKAKML